TNTANGVLYAHFRLHAELLHLHGIGPALLAPVAKGLGMKVIVTYHSRNYEHRKWNGLARSVLRIGELCAVTFADPVIVVSQCLATSLRQRFPWAAARISFIPNGATHLIAFKWENHFGDDVLARYGLEDKKYIISVGRLVPEKGLHDLCQAFKAAHIAYKLVIVGAADHADKYAARLLEQASGTIIFSGFVAHDVLERLLQSGSLFVLPSYNEGLPIAALEAAVAGVPVLMSDIEPNRELGFQPENYFRVGDINDLRHKIMQEHEHYRVNRDRIVQKYDWSLVAAETEKIYAKVEAEVVWRQAR